MVELPENWKKILDFVVDAPIAWQSPEEIAQALRQDVEETTDLLSDMDAAGWISVWDLEPGPVVTLSTLAAYHYGVILVEMGPEDEPRWSPVGDPAPVPPRGKHLAKTDLHARQDQAFDPAPAPDLSMERAEELAHRAARYRQHLTVTCRIEDLPLPCYFLGQGLTPWPGPAESRGPERCPACAGRPLMPHAYCLYCNRWGLDDVLVKLVAQSEKRNPPEASQSGQPMPDESDSSLPEPSPQAPDPVAPSKRLRKKFKNDGARVKVMRKLWRAKRMANG
jgi:hypothetical protein